MLKLIIGLALFYILFPDRGIKNVSGNDTLSGFGLILIILFLGGYFINNFFSPEVILILLIIIIVVCASITETKLKNENSRSENFSVTPQDIHPDNVQILQWVRGKDLSTLKQYLGEPDFSEKVGKSTWKLTYLKYDVCINHKTGIIIEVYSNSKPD